MVQDLSDSLASGLFFAGLMALLMIRFKWSEADYAGICFVAIMMSLIASATGLALKGFPLHPLSMFMFAWGWALAVILILWIHDDFRVWRADNGDGTLWVEQVNAQGYSMLNLEYFTSWWRIWYKLLRWRYGSLAQFTAETPSSNSIPTSQEVQE